MKHRYTIKELAKPDDKDYLSDTKLLRAIVTDRMSDCTNIHAPLYVRLRKLYNKLDKQINEEINNK